MTKYEKTRLIGVRAEQIAQGALPLVDVSTIEEITPINIALAELVAGTIPYIIARTMPDGSQEFWEIKQLNIMN